MATSYGRATLLLSFSIVLAALIVALGNVAAAPQEPAETRVTRLERSIDDVLLLAARTCALRVHEDGSAGWERDDDARELCAEFVSQIGR